jgi:hypothetical protein
MQKDIHLDVIRSGNQWRAVADDQQAQQKRRPRHPGSKGGRCPPLSQHHPICGWPVCKSRALGLEQTMSLDLWRPRNLLSMPPNRQPPLRKLRLACRLHPSVFFLVEELLWRKGGGGRWQRLFHSKNADLRSGSWPFCSCFRD